MKLQVIETFDSIQGEGYFIGTPSHFIRFASCNLACRWCDTRYASNPDPGSYKELLPIELTTDIRQGPNDQMVVLTGGEPLVQDIATLTQLCARLHLIKRKILVETNGTLYKESLIPLVNYWSVSPKLPSSGTLYDIDVLTKYLLLSSVLRAGKRASLREPNVYFKFVISTTDDLIACKDLFNKFIDIEWEGVPIIFQPDNYNCKDINAYLEKLEWLVERVLEDIVWRDLGVRVIPQMHQMLWGKKRGV